MAPTVDFLLDTTEPIAALATELDRLIGIKLSPTPQGGYTFEAMTLTLDLRELAADAPYRYQITITGTFGTEAQRIKWSEDWGFGILRTLRETGKYRVKRVTAEAVG